MSQAAIGRLTVGRLMAIIAAVAVLLAAGMYRWQNLDIDRAAVSAALGAIRTGPTAEARRRAAVELREVKPVNPAPVIAALMAASVGDPAPEVREAALNSLGSVFHQAFNSQKLPGKPSDADLEPTRVILRALSDPARPVRVAALEATGAVQGAGLVTPALSAAIAARLLAALDDPDPETRLAATLAFAWCPVKPAGAYDRILTLIEHDPDARLRSGMTRGLCRAWPSADLYRDLLKPRAVPMTAEERLAILECLLIRDVPPPESIPTLISWMDGDEKAAYWVPVALGRLGKEGRPWLGPLAQVAARELRADPAARSPALEALIRIDPDSPEAQAVLEPICRQFSAAPTDEARERCAWLLLRFGQAALPAVPMLCEALHSPTPAIRRDAAHILGGFSPPATAGLADLEALSQHDPDATVRAEASRAVANSRQP